MKVQNFSAYHIGDIVQIVALAVRQGLYRPHLSQHHEDVSPEEVILWLPKDRNHSAWVRRYYYTRPYYFVGVKTVYEGIIRPSLTDEPTRWEPSHGVRLARLRYGRQGKEVLAWAIQPYMVPANRAMS